MEDTLLQIAERVKALRDICGFEIEEVAEQAEVPVEKYLRYENGEKEFPISVLLRLSAMFGVDPAVLLTGAEPRLRVYTLTRSGQGRGVERHEEYRYRSLAYNFTNKSIEPFEVTTDPVEPGTPIVFNAHDGQEFDYLLEGRMRLIINDNELHLEPGDCVFFDSSYPHGMQAIGDTPARFMAIVIPPKE